MEKRIFMARIFDNHTLALLKDIGAAPGSTASGLFERHRRGRDYKAFYNTLYRLIQQGLLERKDTLQGMKVSLTADGGLLLKRLMPERGGVWKLVIFDIPEKQKYVRTVLRAKLKALGFRKWQNSIWVSPYALDGEVEQELAGLAKKFFVRLIKTTDINVTDDLEKMFAA
jgi:DNA-binding transcriptional regulator PaaX